MAQESRLHVAAIRFGTTYLGFAYSFRNDFEANPRKVYILTIQAESTWMPKIPSSILFSPDKTFHSFGMEAEEEYAKLCNGCRKEAKQWYFFKSFKLQFHNNETLMVTDDTMKKQMPALDVFSAAIGYLKELFFRELIDPGSSVPDSPVPDSQITWVLTVPMTWPDAAQEILREAAEKAGIPGEQLVLVLEPEAAFVSCLETHESKQTLCSPLNISQPGKKFILVDCGGETVDISAFKVGEGNTLQHLHRHEGTCQGGTRVDETFREFLFDLMGTDGLASCDKLELLFLMHEFESALCTQATSKKISLKMPATIKSIVEDTIRKISTKMPATTKSIVEDVIRKIGRHLWSGSYRLQGKGSVVQDNLVLDRGLFLSFFEKAAQSIPNSIREVMNHEKVKSVDAILLAGGFSKSDVIQDAVKKAFPRDKVLMAPNPPSAVLIGALMYGHNPDVINFSERERLTQELQKKKENEDNKREAERLTQELLEMMKEHEDIKREVKQLKEDRQQKRIEKEHRETEAKNQIVSLTATKREMMMKEIEDVKREVKQMRIEKEHREAKNQIASLTAELEKIKKNMKDADREAQRLIGSLTEELQKVKREKEDEENERMAQIASLEEELLQVQRDRSTLTAEAEKTAAEQEQDRMESAEIQRKAEATIEALQDQLENTQRAEEETKRTLLQKTEHCNSLGGLVAKLETERKQLHKEVVALQRKLLQAQTEMQKAEDRHCLKLEKEMQVSEEFRRQLQRLSEESDFRSLITESLQRVEDKLNEVAANMEDTNYRSESSLDRDFMNRLPGDVKRKCLQIQSLIGGMGREFGERLLGRHVAWSREELEGSGFFFTRSKFWLCIRKWVEASSVPNTDAPLTLDHLTSVCRKLSANPTSLTEMSWTQVQVLEGNFSFLAKRTLVIEVVAYLRNAKKLTEEARAFLLTPGTPRQNVDRLLAVLYSMGKEGYFLLLEALEVTKQPHVVHRLKEDQAFITRAAHMTQEVEIPEDLRQVSDPGQNTIEVRDDDIDNHADEQQDDDQGPDVLHEERQGATLQDLQRLLEARHQATIRQVAEECRVLMHSVQDHISVNQNKIVEKLDAVKNTIQKCFDEMYTDIRANVSKPSADK